MEAKYENLNKSQVNVQIALALVMLSGKVGVLKTSGGKSEAFNLLMAYLYRKGENVFYTTSSSELIFRDAIEKLKFLNNQRIKEYLQVPEVKVTYIKPGTTDSSGDKLYELYYKYDDDVEGKLVANDEEVNENSLLALSSGQDVGKTLDYDEPHEKLLEQGKGKIVFAPIQTLAYLKQQHFTEVPKINLLLDEADYIINEPTEYAVSQEVKLSKVKETIVKCIQECIEGFYKIGKNKKFIIHKEGSKRYEFHRNSNSAQKEIKNIKNYVKQQFNNDTEKKEAENIVESQEFIDMIDAALHVKISLQEGTDYEVTYDEKNKKPLIRIRGLDGILHSPNVRNKETINLALIAYINSDGDLHEKWKEQYGVGWPEGGISLQGSNTLDRDNFFSIRNWIKDNKGKVCAATGTEAAILKAVGDVVEIPSTQGAADKEIGLFIEENEAKKQEKIGKILRKFNINDGQQQEQGQNKPIAFILEKDAKKAREMKKYLEKHRFQGILLLDGSDATAYNKNKVAIEEGKYDIVIATQMLDRGVNLNEIKRDKLLIRAYIASYSTEIQQKARVGRGKQENNEFLIDIYSIEGIEEVAKENELERK